jgi:hypothetical protein
MAVRVALESASVMLVMLLDAVEAAMPQQYRTPSNWKNEWGFITTLSRDTDHQLQRAWVWSQLQLQDGWRDLVNETVRNVPGLSDLRTEQFRGILDKLQSSPDLRQVGTCIRVGSLGEDGELDVYLVPMPGGMTDGIALIRP